jgi:phage terminase Nu1 subunit (DNA packaging protein)
LNPKKEVRDFRVEIVSASEAALFLGISRTAFFNLASDGVIPRHSEGEYMLGDVSEAYWKHCLASDGLEAEQTRLTKAKADLAEMELADQRGETYRASAVMRVWADNVMNAKTKLLSIPSKIAPELEGKPILEMQARLKEVINEALNELAEYDERRIARAAAAFRE